MCVIFLLTLASSARPADAQPVCDTALDEAEAHYTAGAFSEAITVLGPCMRSFPAGSDTEIAAHRLLALAYLRNDEIDEARLVIVELLARHPSYVADPVTDPPAFVSLVNLVREETGTRSTATDGAPTSSPRTWLSSPRTWLIVGGGAAAAAAAILLLGGSGGNGGPQPLPLPPAFP